MLKSENTSEKILNYRVIIEPETYEDGSTVYVAQCPTLGISDYGDTIEKAIEHMQRGMKLYINTLLVENLPVPEQDHEGFFITNQKVSIKTHSTSLQL
jgi:predicted RNase H-like HicB family nuclease